MSRPYRVPISLSQMQLDWLNHLSKHHDMKRAQVAYHLFTDALKLEMDKPEHRAERLAIYKRQRHELGHVPIFDETDEVTT